MSRHQSDTLFLIDTEYSHGKGKRIPEAQKHRFSAKRYGIDALGAMAQGLFCSLLIGTILNTLGTQFHIGFLTAQIGEKVPYTIGGLTSFMSGPAMAIAIGYALQAPPLVLFSLAAVGYACNLLGAAPVDPWQCCSWPSSPLRSARP